MVGRAWGWLLAIGLVSLPTMVGAAPSQAELDAVKVAETRGAQLFAYDQAAWHASDSFQADISKQAISNEVLTSLGLEGYVTEPGPNNELMTTFFGKRDDKRFAYARYWTLDGKVVRGGIITLGEDAALSAIAARMIAARNQAIATAIADKSTLCSKSPPNTLVLPPDENGIVSAYLMTSTSDNSLYPGGGHYRFDSDAKGELVSKRQFMKSCFDFDSRSRNGKQPAAVIVTHLLDPQPTEIHAFASYYVPIPIGVATVTNKEIWMVAKGHIRFARDIGK